MTTTTTPIAQRERIQMLDVIRGFALLGILLMNIEYFQRPLNAIIFGLDQSLSGLDYGVGWSVFTFIQGKFYTMFSLLFGMGFAIFCDRARQHHPHPRILFLRRAVILALFGFVHIYAIWGGDILLTYAICAMVLVLFMNVRASLLWKWGVAFYVLPLLMVWLAAASYYGALQDPTTVTKMLEDAAASNAELKEFLVLANTVYAEGSWSAIVEVRMKELNMLYGSGNFIFFLPSLLGTFLIGASFARSGIFTSFDKHPLAYKNLLRWGLIFGLPSAVYIGLYHTDTSVFLPNFSAAFSYTVTEIANMGLCLAYMSIIALALRGAQRAKREHWLRHLAPAGRMALTNYLMHSIVFTTLFYGYGFALYGEISRSLATALAISLWLLQLPMSKWWLSRYRFGPCEWLWRSLTYGERQPFKL